MTALTSAIKAALGLIVVLLVLGVASTVIAGGVYLLGFVSMGTAQAIWLTFMAAGAGFAVLIGILQMLIAGEARNSRSNMNRLN